MDDGKLLVVGGETDILHCGFSHSISHEGRRYPSAEHFTHSVILAQLKLNDSHILELLSCRSSEVKHRAKQLLTDNMPQGHSLESLRGYLDQSRQSYTMEGLRLRFQQDPAFEKALMETKESLLIVCDPNDREMGIGMDEAQFMELVNQERLDAQKVGLWMRSSQHRPPHVGANQLGYLLMWLRYEEREKRRNSKISFEPHVIDGISTDDDGNLVKISCNDQIVFLKGIFQPLSNYYAHPFEMKGGRYRSVEHYAYEKLFNSLRLDEKCVEKIITTVDPCVLKKVADKVFAVEKIDEEVLQSKLARLDRWRQSAMKHKIMKIEYLQQLLLSTGQALLVDCAPIASDWTCSTVESELQHLLTKEYVTNQQLVEWMCAVEPPRRIAHLQGNKGAILLMELRTKIAEVTPSRIPLVIPPVKSSLIDTISHHLICFTPESVFCPLYPAEIRVAPDQPLLPSPAHYVAQETAKYFMFNDGDTRYVLEERSSIECWRRLYETVDACYRGQERAQMWFMEKRQKMIHESLRMLFEQHAPLLRALLDTNDVFLAYCARWGSVDSELSVGMREQDLRQWLAYVDLGTKQLIELCTRPLAFRPPFLGGNRLGFILMDLRAEFRAKGAIPWALPELKIGTETILGTDSPAESLIIDEPFDALDERNYVQAWANPLLLLAKKMKEQSLMNIARLPKACLRLLTADELKLQDHLSKIDAWKTTKLDTTWLAEVPPEELRALVMRLSARVRQKATECDKQQKDLSDLSFEITQMQYIRRGIENEVLKKPATKPAFSTPSAANDTPPTSGYRSSQRPRSPAPRQSSGQDRKEFRSEERRSKGRAPRDMPVRVPFIPKKPEELKEFKSAPPPKKEPAPPKPKKERPVDEELSDGEILDSDED
ncbi:unnamed protein product, partial [Mesorhabditis spiculigera]